jgi:ABC-2 type transport system ATP-binding protein
MIEVSHLTKYYGDFPAVQNISFSAQMGEVLGFLGPNGAGKSTTMRIITGFIPASQGTVTVDGFDVFKESHEVRRRLGYLPENPPLYSDMTVSSYLKFVARIKGVPKTGVLPTLDATLEKCSLESVANRLIRHLSKGYRQRVGLAQALIHDPPVLILDEPTLGLDPKQTLEIRNLINDLAEDRTVILSTHILPEVSQICNKLVIINEGKLVLEQDLQELTRGATLEDVFIRTISEVTEEHLAS